MRFTARQGVARRSATHGQALVRARRQRRHDRRERGNVPTRHWAGRHTAPSVDRAHAYARAASATACLAIVILAGVTAGCSDQRDKGTTAVTPTLTTAVDLHNRYDDADLECPGGGAGHACAADDRDGDRDHCPRLRQPPVRRPPTTITRPAGQSSPTLAATGLVAAWQAGDRAAAATYADPPAVKTMFTITREPVQAAGPCQQDGEAFSCPYFAKSGNTFYLRSVGSRATGYRIAHVTTPTD